MSETLPSQQNETQAWKQELQPHREINDRLNPDEALSLMGSFTGESLEDVHELQDTMDEKDYQKSVRVKEAALSELSELDLEGVGVADAISDRKAQLEQEILEHAKRADIPSKIASTFKLEGLKDLESTYLTIDENIRIAGRGSTGMEAVKARAAHINEMILEHNERVSRGSESIADSPEIREAQERINARYAEQAKQPQPTETVDNARQKVAEAFGDTSEKEYQALMGEVARAAKGTTSIHTDIPAGFSVPAKEGAGRGDGFTSFGDGTQFNNMDVVTRKTNLQRSAESPETIIFRPETTTEYKTVIKTVETGGRFRKKTEQVEKQVPTGKVLTMVTNPATGQQEPGVKVAYLFNGNGAQYSLDGNPPYLTKSGRSGNQLYVESTLPKSIAEQLSREVADKPELAREYAEALVLNNGIPQELWDSIVRPPYNKLSSDWKITIANQ